MDQGCETRRLWELIRLVIIPPLKCHEILITRIVILLYGVLFMDWGEMAGTNGKPFEGVSHTCLMDHMLKDLADVFRDS